MNNFLIKMLVLFIFITSLFSGLPVSKEATLIERVSSSESMVEATGKYISKEKKERKAKKDVDENGVSRAILWTFFKRLFGQTPSGRDRAAIFLANFHPSRR